MDVHVFQSDTGAALPGPVPTDFGFPTYARLRERAPAVAREPNTLETAHARYVSTGEKEVLEVTRLSAGGHALWRRRLEFPRIDVADAKVEIVDGQVFVMASGLGPVRPSVHRLWALGSQGQVLWERELSVPYSQLARVFVGQRYLLCGLGETRGIGGLPPSWRCYRPDGVLEVDTTLAFAPRYRALEVSHVFGHMVHLRVVEPANESAASIRFFVIDGYANLISQPVWPIDESEGKGLTRIDTIVHRDIDNLVSASVYDSVDAFEASALLVAAFEYSGRRLWQRRIEQPLRGSDGSHTHIALDADNNGIVHVAFHPRLGLDEFPLRVCRLSAKDGSLMGCSDTPLYGRVGAVFTTTQPPASWMWANQTLGPGQSALTLFPLTADGIGAPIYQHADLQLRLAGSVTRRFDRSWAVVEPASYAGVFGDTVAPSTRVLLFQPDQIFADGFEPSP